MSAKQEWLNLVEVSGPFLSVPVLREVFPQGLDELDTTRAQRLRGAYEEWREAVDGDDAALEAIHRAWIDEVLHTALDVDDSMLKRADGFSSFAVSEHPEHDHRIVSDLVVVDPTHDDAIICPIHVLPPDTDLDASMRFGGLMCSPADRMALHLRALGKPFGLATNGERWMLVHAPVGQVSGFASWYARLWAQEPETLRAFGSILGTRRFFAPEDERLPALYERSLTHQDEVTDALGEQVRRAVEVLVQALDRADQDRNRELLRDVEPKDLYEAGLTVMMRLVFLLAAEERGLLLLGEPRYDSFYAISTLRMQLRTESDEILERRRSAWSRLLAVFRAVYGGVEHPTLRLPALGGSLFDPDRFPFLEGRKKETSWRTQRAEPLPIDDRTVLLLLDAIQTFEGRTLSYRALDVEQIGHVYEGLLERTVKRVDDVTLELEGTKSAKDPQVQLAELESAQLDGNETVVALLRERTKRSKSALTKKLGQVVEGKVGARLLAACRGDVVLRDRLEPYAHLLRTDPWGYPLVHTKGAFVVVLGVDRRETGTHYTPRSLTEKIVQETLTPLVYEGPAEGVPRGEWKLKSPADLLDLKVCDPAMGSGAFLVQACRFLASRLVESWALAESNGGHVDVDGRVRESRDEIEPLPECEEARAEHARRLVVERCLYGVDLNPLAVELAKLSLWLVTLSKGRPFGFLDHNLRPGDSLLGIHRLDQLTKLSMTPDAQTQERLFGKNVWKAVDEAMAIRQQLRAVPLRDIRDVEAMADLEAAARAKVEVATGLADAFIGLVFVTESSRDEETRLAMLSAEADGVIERAGESLHEMRRRAAANLSEGTLDRRPMRPFHWPLQFPEVFIRANGGFDAFVGNPPFLGNRLWKGSYGPALGRIVEMVLETAPGKIDLCVAFHRRAASLLRNSGTYGLLARTNIAEGSALSVGLERIAEHGAFYFTRKGMPWPGAASTVVAIICFRRDAWSGIRDCDGVECDDISPRLQVVVAGGWEPKRLRYAMYAFAGVDNSKGLAFVVAEDHPWFERLRSETNSLLRPYITGCDITSTALTRTERWALDIADRSLEELASKWPVAHRFLVEVVKPTRTHESLKSYKGLIDRWWQFWNHRAKQMARIRQRPDFIAFAKAAKYAICVRAPSEWIYTNQVVILERRDEDTHPLCLSSVFREWVRNYSVQSLGRDNSTMRLSVSKAINAFPRPPARIGSAGADSATEFQETLTSWSMSNGTGMTDAINAVHESTVSDRQIRRMRRCLESIDTAVAKAYGWSGLDLSHDFRDDVDAEGARVTRYGLAETTRHQVLTFLIKLNRFQHMEGKERPKTSTGKAPEGQLNIENHLSEEADS